MERLSGTAVPGHLTVSPPLASRALEAMCAPTRELWFRRLEGHLAVTSSTGPPRHSQLRRRSCARTLRTVLAPAPSSPAQAPPGPSLPPCFPHPRALPFFPPPLLNRAPAACLSPHPSVRSGGGAATAAGAAPLLFRVSPEHGLLKITGATFGLGSALSACARTGRSDQSELGVRRCGNRFPVARRSRGCAARLAFWPSELSSWWTGSGTLGRG